MDLPQTSDKTSGCDVSWCLKHRGDRPGTKSVSCLSEKQLAAVIKGPPLVRQLLSSIPDSASPQIAEHVIYLVRLSGVRS